MTTYLNCTQAASAARCSIYQIREAIKTGELKAFRPGKSYLIDPADLETWVRNSVVEARKKPTGC